ncbi:MAG: glycosyltransferase [Firmicutes bacterium]|nr:glycosyltransferase [Bacillota bacterium]
MMEGHLKVSIITISYNSAPVIEQAILSVIGQTYSSIEYIVIDGGSTDGTVDIINKYADKIAFWVSEPDTGISNAWNKGLSRCTGDIVGILNADDTYTPDAVNLAVQELAKNPAAGFVFGDILMYDMQGVPCFRQEGDPGYESTIAFDMPSIPHPTVFMRRAVYQENGGFDEMYRTAMDYEFLLRITVNGVKGTYLPTVLVNMRLGGESDFNYAHGYREVMTASEKYGYNKPMAMTRFYCKCLKTIVRKNLQRIGLDFPVRVYRTYVGRRYKY